MAQVYANDPGSAFAMNANLDQQRVQNYLQSIAANRNAQLQGWQAAQQMAAARQAQEQQQQAQMLQLAHLAAQQQQAQQNFGLSQGNLAEIIRHNQASEGKANASEDILNFNKEKDARAQAELATQSENIAKYLNERDGLNQLTAQLPSEAAAKEAGSEDFWHWPPFSNKAVNAKRAAFSGRLADLTPQDILQQANFTNAEGPVDYRKAIADAITARTAQVNPMIPKNEAELNSLVTFRNGRYEPNFRVNPLLTSGTATAAPATAPDASVSAEGIRQDFQNGRIDRETARQALRALGYK